MITCRKYLGEGLCQLSNQPLKQLRFLASPSAKPIGSESSTTFEQEWQAAKPYAEVPTMGLLRMLRNFLPGGKFAKLDVADMIMVMRTELGPISKMKGTFGRPDSVFTHSPQDIEKLLHNQGIWPLRPGSEGLSYHRNNHRSEFFQGVEGLIASNGENWGSFRSTVNPILMQPKNVRLYLQKMSTVGKELLNRILEIRDPNTYEVPSNFEEELNLWALESISIVALDKKLGLLSKNRDNEEAKKLFKLITEFFTLSVDIEFKPPIWKYYKTKTFNRLMETLDGMTDISRKYVNEAIQRIEEDRSQGVPEKPESEQSVLEKLITIDKKIATVMAMDMLMAGVDTTTSTLTGIMLCLSKNPEKQAKLRQEIMQVLPHKNSDFDELAFNNLPYLRACIKESLRFYPLGFGNARISVTDMVLSGYQVPKGTMVVVVNMSMLTNDEFYPRASEFLPERWLRTHKDETTVCGNLSPQDLKPRNPFVYFPFGFGARSCIGRRIVEMELELAVARLVRNFHIEFNHSTENAFKSLLIRVPNIPLKFKFTDVEK
ncbi:cytochrome P450 CYP12A2 [Stomoxys calcitrans]|uniref:cytochrome P450 CYP12A2 n=1 Tax=Stomoxys calcitrans TaxID=35570 RepID=UPI0027E274E8|nr:cytochrome P450 CYP12A2 [Stomoxys calcitrans]